MVYILIVLCKNILYFFKMYMYLNLRFRKIIFIDIFEMYENFIIYIFYLLSKKKDNWLIFNIID